MCVKKLESILFEYIRLYGLTDDARQYFIQHPSKDHYDSLAPASLQQGQKCDCASASRTE